MAAYTSPAIPITMAPEVDRTAWRRVGSQDDTGKHENGDVGQSTIQEKTNEFFQICDVENKGFISRRDMQRLIGGLPLSADELENVFDTLDIDGNGYLTLDEFSSGFSEFVFGKEISKEEGMEEKPAAKSTEEVLYQTQWEENLVKGDEEEEEKHFSMLMESLGANCVFEEPSEVRSLWAQLRRDEPHLLANFEDFLARVTAQILEANQEKKEMESALKRKVATHGDEIKRLYEEMELQIKHEKEKLVVQDYGHFVSLNKDLELQLSSKEKELEHLFQKQKKLETECEELHSEQHDTKVENMKLKQTNDDLTLELEQTSQELTLAQDQLCQLQQQSSQLHVEKEMEIYRVTEGLQREQASLLKQLDILREINKHLQDEKDMSYQKPRNLRRPLRRSMKHTHIFKSEDEEELTTKQNVTSVLDQSEGKHLQRIISIEEDHPPHLLQDGCQSDSPLEERSEEEEGSDREEKVDLTRSENHPDETFSHQLQEALEREAPTSPRGQPVGKETSIHEEIVSTTPDRLFKIVLVGNSSVGKTSLLRRFCDDSFHPGTSATVGVDYSVKTVTVDMRHVALQMWDTAGQERYRSITKQFFRKADGVVVMYDITAEQSFTAVRQWLTSVKESAGEDIPVMLLGNKTDKEMERQVQEAVGEQLAKECQMTFYECSAYSGHNVMESMVQLARILMEQEDREKEKTVQLVCEAAEKKRSCC